MCLYPRLIKNKKYMPNKKNGGQPPFCNDYRTLYVPVGCGVCKECMQQKANQWKIRLFEELKVQQYALYVTFTFSPTALQQLTTKYEEQETNATAGKAIRLFLERWRKRYKKSLRHWLITELGHEGTERIHLHGIIFPKFKITNQDLENIWSYGNIRVGDYCNLETINYIAKYITKTDFDHKGYIPQIFCSSGIGRNYTEKILTKQIHRFNGNNTIEYYQYPNGTKVNLPIYYRNKFFTEEQREELWINKIEENKRYVLGICIENINTIEGEDRYFRVLRKAQELNRQAGYGDNTKEWQKKKYNVTLRMLNKGKNNKEQ